MKTIKFIATVSLSYCIAMTSIAAADETKVAKKPTLSQQELADGWKFLFDGSSTDGWRGYKKDSFPEGWKNVDGALTRVGKGGDIVTKDQYGAFELKLEFKISSGGNSGVIYHVLETQGAPWQTGPEIQIQDNKDGHDPQKCGWLYQLYSSEVDATKPAGEWNELHIIITPEKCEHYVNGKKYCEYVKGSSDWTRSSSQ